MSTINKAEIHMTCRHSQHYRTQQVKFVVNLVWTNIKVSTIFLFVVHVVLPFNDACYIYLTCVLCLLEKSSILLSNLILIHRKWIRNLIHTLENCLLWHGLFFIISGLMLKNKQMILYASSSWRYIYGWMQCIIILHTSGARTNVCRNFRIGCPLLESSPITWTTTPSLRVAWASTCRIFVWHSLNCRDITFLCISYREAKKMLLVIVTILIFLQVIHKHIRNIKTYSLPIDCLRQLSIRIQSTMDIGWVPSIKSKSRAKKRF